MEIQEKNQRLYNKAPPEPVADLFLQWGTRKRLRCLRVRVRENHPHISDPSNTGGTRRKITRNSEAATKLGSPEKEDRHYTTRGSVDENVKVSMDGGERVFGEDNKGLVWPKLYITLSNKEKEEDFMAMKGCKPSQRPKKRAKIIQRTLLLVSPGAWLSDMCQERYEVREKKSSKKRPRGLKAMGSMESDSE